MKLLVGLNLVFVVAAIFGAIGWVINLLDVVHMALANTPLTTMFVLRVVGIPVPILGAILGWF